jgi:hypothetical protein
MLDSMKYVKLLETKGFSREQAEAQVEMVREVMDNNFATKRDLEKLEFKLESRLDLCVESLKTEMHKLHNKTIMSLAGIMGIFFAIEKFLK